MRVPSKQSRFLTFYVFFKWSLTYFDNINYEGIVTNRTPVFKDSVLQSTPLLAMECRDVFGNATKIKAYLKELNDERFDHEGNKIVFDPEYYDVVKTRLAKKGQQYEDSLNLLAIDEDIKFK